MASLFVVSHFYSSKLQDIFGYQNIKTYTWENICIHNMAKTIAFTCAILLLKLILIQQYYIIQNILIDLFYPVILKLFLLSLQQNMNIEMMKINPCEKY